MKKKWMTEVGTALLVLLFIYTGASKLTDFTAFGRSIHKQHLAIWLTQLIIWALPAAEIITALLLAIPRSRKAGLWISLGLLTLFTGYICGILLHLFNRVPCPCGGIIRTLNWQQHLCFNLLFIFINVMTIWMQRRENRKVEPDF